MTISANPILAGMLDELAAQFDMTAEKFTTEILQRAAANKINVDVAIDQLAHERGIQPTLRWPRTPDMRRLTRVEFELGGNLREIALARANQQGIPFEEFVEKCVASGIEGESNKPFYRELRERYHRESLGKPDKHQR